MKKKLILLVVMMSLGLLITGCAQEKTNKESNSNKSNQKTTSEKKSVLTTVNGIDITEIEVNIVGKSGTPNLSVVFANNTNEDKEFDCSKFSIHYGDGEEANIIFGKRTIEANKPRMQVAMQFDAEGLKVGDKVEVYYDGKKIIETEAVKFG